MTRALCCLVPLTLGALALTSCDDTSPTQPEPAGREAGVADLQGTGSPITVTLLARVDGFLRDGNLAVDRSIVQVLHDPSMQDRGIIKFDIRSIPGPVLKATLSLTVYASSGPYPFRVDVYGFRGNGYLEVSDWNRGTLITSFQYAGEPTVVLDVTSKVQMMRANGATFASFNFRAEPNDIPKNGPYVAFHSREWRPAATLRIKTQ